jgi:hypothetical protein
MSGLWPTVCRVSFQLFRWLDERAEEENPVRNMAQAAYRAPSGQNNIDLSESCLPQPE